MPSSAPVRSDGSVTTEPDRGTGTDQARDAGDHRRSTGTRDGVDVAAIFDEIAPVYDRLGSILSLGLDGRWRHAVVAAPASARATP